jgi:ribonucleoside-diphosphate reductase alpha chain
MELLSEEPGRAHVVVNPHTGQTGVLSKGNGVADYVANPERTSDFYTVAEIWDRIVQHAWQCGDPGLIFIDEVNRHNQVPQLGAIRATNPCGEQPLLPYEACNLGSINLSTFRKTPSADASGEPIDWDRLGKVVELAVRFLDDVVDANKYPTQEIHEASHATRKIGLGVMGFADLLFKLGIAYDSDESLDLAERIGAFIRDRGWAASQRLAETRGPFPAWSGSMWDTEHGQPIRNAHVTTIAPTGTISIIAGCSSGIEPLFSLAFTRQVLDGKKLVEVNPIFEAALREHITEETRIQEIIEHATMHGSIQDLRDVPIALKTVFRTARDISPDWHVRMQAAWQRHTDAAVSKTVNLPADASIHQVESAFQLAHELKCKGITVYRDGARSDQPMALADDDTTMVDVKPTAEPTRPIRLPEIIPSVRLRQPTPFGNMHLHISVDPEVGRERELFAQLGKGGDLANSDLEAICRLVSLLLRSDADVRTIIDQLEGIGSSLSVPSKDGRIKSLGDALAHALRKYVLAKERDGLDAILCGRVKSLDGSETSHGSTMTGGQEALFKIKCPDCDSAGTLAFEEGCLKCHACGYSMC